MNREQVFLAVLTGVVACGPKFKKRERGQCGPEEVDYNKMIMITNNVTDAVMRSVDPAENRKDVCYSDLIQSNRDLEEKSIQHQTTAMRLQAEVDRLKEQANADLENDRDLAAKLNRELTESRTNFNEACKTIEAKEFKILEIEEEIKRLERELQSSNQALAAAGTRPTWHHLREVEKELQNAKLGLKAVADVVLERDATIDKLQADKDALSEKFLGMEHAIRNLEEVCRKKDAKIDHLTNVNGRLQREKSELDKAALDLKSVIDIHVQDKKNLQADKVALQKDIDRILQAIKGTDGEIHHMAGMVKSLQADKDALRKAVEDGAMEIERLRNTLKGVEHIASMKPEDVEALAKYAQEGCGWVPNILDNEKARLFRDPAEIKLVGEPDVRDGKVYSVGIVSEEIWPMTVPEVVPVDLKNDLSSAVANSTEGQRVVVEDLEATVESDPEEWVMITDPEPEHVMRECDWLGAKNEHEYLITAKRADAVGKRAGIYIAEPDPMFLRCRRKDLPVVEVKDAEVVAEVVAEEVAEDPEEYVLITYPEHTLRACDDYCCCDVYRRHANDEASYLQDPPTGGWISCSYSTHMIGNKVSNNDGLVYRCKRKDLPVTPPAAESQS